MKMLSMKMMALMAGIGYMGYMYFSKHPEVVQKIKDLGKNTSEQVSEIVTEK